MGCEICLKQLGIATPTDVMDILSTHLSHKKYEYTTNVVGCRACGYVRLQEPPPKAALDLHYSQQGRIPTETIAYKEQAAFITDNMKEMSHVFVLDIGAFDGRLLDCLAEAGVTKTYAIEPDETELGHNRFSTLLDAAGTLSENSLGLITMGHVFEHIQKPSAMLETIAYMLQPGGALFIEVPDLEEPQVQLVPYWTPYHQSYFTIHTLTYMLEVAGFEVKAIERTGYRSLRVFARSWTTAFPNQGDTPPAHSAYYSAGKYIERREKLLEELREKLSWLHNDALAIFGTGDHTYWLLKEFPDLLKNTEAFLDSDPKRQGLQYYGKPILAPEHCPEFVDTVITSSYDSQDEMATAIGKRAFQLYEDVRAYDVWLGEKNGV